MDILKNPNWRWRWFISCEKLLVRLAIFCIILLLFAQVLLLKEKTRIYVSEVDRLEGQAISLELPLYAGTPSLLTEKSVAGAIQAHRKSKTIIIRMVKPLCSADVYVAVNGTKIDNFKQGTIMLTVYDGDYVEIDATSLKEQTSFIVNTPETELSSPHNGLLVKSESMRVSLPRVQFKS